jgi:hypothetical protein
MTDLPYATTDLSELRDTAAQLAEPLIRSGLLVARGGSLPPRWNDSRTATTESTSTSNSRKERTSLTPHKREPAPRSKSRQPWNSSYDLLRRLNCPGRRRPPDPQIKTSSRSRASVDLTCTELTLRDDLGRLAPHGVPREQTRDARETSRP